MAKQTKPAFILPILMVCIAILATYYFIPKSDAIRLQGGEISLSLDGWPFVSGNTATLRAVSTCGAFGVWLDGAVFGNGEPVLSRQFLAEAGSHSFFAQGKDCNSTLAFNVLARECDGNETKECENNGCAGVRRCEAGIFSDCMLPKKICYPGERVGCSTNSCSFGHMACNPCGTSFGECTAGSKIGNASCNGTPSCT